MRSQKTKRCLIFVGSIVVFDTLFANLPNSLQQPIYKDGYISVMDVVIIVVYLILAALCIMLTAVSIENDKKCDGCGKPCFSIDMIADDEDLYCKECFEMYHKT